MVAEEPRVNFPRPATISGAWLTLLTARKLIVDSGMLPLRKLSVAPGAMIEPLTVMLDAVKFRLPRLKVLSVVVSGTVMEPSGLLTVRLLKPLVVSSSGLR